MFFTTAVEEREVDVRLVADLTPVVAVERVERADMVARVLFDGELVRRALAYMLVAV